MISIVSYVRKVPLTSIISIDITTALVQSRSFLNVLSAENVSLEYYVVLSAIANGIAFKRSRDSH